VVSDAGMPGISDPGFRLVSLAVERGLPVIPIPGAAAFVSAVVASGLPSEAFSFRGFLSPKSAARRLELEQARNSTQTEVFYEAPHRILAALEDVLAVLGPRRRIVVARELTKIHEEFLRGTTAEVLDSVKSRGEIKGEMVLMIGPAEEPENAVPTVSIRDRVEQLMREEHLDEKAALKKAAKERGISKSAAYREWQLPK
jgi:16S rRNA (cytidine1402-2'-O)-methyltransferase